MRMGPGLKLRVGLKIGMRMRMVVMVMVKMMTRDLKELAEDHACLRDETSWTSVWCVMGVPWLWRAWPSTTRTARLKYDDEVRDVQECIRKIRVVVKLDG